MPNPMTLEHIDRMSPDEERRFIKVFESQLTFDDGAEARSHLAAGRPIVYSDSSTPEGHVIRKYPDGKLELVNYKTGTPQLVKVLKP